MKVRVGGETVGVVMMCIVRCLWCSGWDWCMVKQHGRWGRVKSIQNCLWTLAL